MAGRRIRRALARLTVATLALATPAVLAAPSASAVPGNSSMVFINEFHYDNDGTDAGEFIEIAGPAGTDLTGWSIVLYNGSNGAVYDTDALSGTLTDQGGGYGTAVIQYPSNGIQNGEPDGIALVGPSGGLVQFLSYEGSFAATAGPAAGETATDIGVSQPGNAPVGSSLQLTGSGTTYADFTWAGPSANTQGAPNTGQTFGDGGPPGPVINEFSASTTGTDVEYVEIFGSSETDYSDHVVLEIEGDAGASAGTIDEVIPVGTTGADGIFLANLPANALENGTITLLLVSGFTGDPNQDLDTDNDGVFDTTRWDSVVDAVAVNDGGAGDLTYGVPVLGVAYDGLPFAPGGASRIPDGTDTDSATDWVRNDFDLAGIPGITGSPITGEALNTPGAPNALAETPPAEVKIHDVQGSGSESPLEGSTVIVEGIVTSLFTSSDAPDGFFLQEEYGDWDDDPTTSEGLFIFCRGECPAEGELAVGDTAQVQGSVTEFFGMTQVSSNVPGGSIVVTAGDISDVPPAVEVDLPAEGSTRDAATFEHVEGMVVEFTDTLVVSEYFELARYGQITLTVDERPYQFTHNNEPSVEGYAEFQADLATRRIILDDDNNTQNDAISGPDSNEPYPWPEGGLSVDNRFRGGDTIENLTGVMHWSFAGLSGTDAWRIRPIQGLDYEFSAANPAPDEPEDVGGRLTVTSYNVLNYFATVDEGATANTCGPQGNQDCRGADSEIERERQLTKIAAGLAEIDADVAGLIEIENDGDDESVNQIVDALNGLTAPGTYDAIETGFIGTDAIKVALIYQPAAVTPYGDYAILDSSVDERFLDTENRPVLIQTFEENSTGGRFTIAVNHLKSKGSDCDALGDPDLLDGQGNCNVTRTAAAEALSDYLATDPTDSGDPDFLIVGDLNAYAKEDPITTLEAAGWTDLLEKFEGPDAYTYVFDGQLGYLDIALANDSLLSQVTGATAWHINADEVPLFDYNDEFRTADEASFDRESDALPLYEPDPLRSSDHDPVIVGLDLLGPADFVADLRATLAEMNLQRGIANALDAKLRAAERSIDRDNAIGACGNLQGFINQVNALTGKKVSPDQAEVLIEDAVALRRALDC